MQLLTRLHLMQCLIVDLVLVVVQVCPDVKTCLVFQCGPAAMMQLVSATLESMQMPMAHVFQEAFGF